MELLGIGPLELAFIILIAVIVIGPRDIGNFARSAGQFLNKLYRSEEWKALNQASRNLRTLPHRLAREAALDELEKATQEAKKAIEGEAPSDSDKPKTNADSSRPSWAPRFPEPEPGMQAWVAPTVDKPAAEEPAKAPSEAPKEASEESPMSDPPA
jgi:Sec-independent protein translocase protein TatA